MDSCRLCFSKGDFLNIFSKNGNELGMAQIIRDHFQCEVNESDSLPPCVCDECWNLTTNFHNFCASVKLAQYEYLATLVKIEIVEEELPSESAIDTSMRNEQEHQKASLVKYPIQLEAIKADNKNEGEHNYVSDDEMDADACESENTYNAKDSNANDRNILTQHSERAAKTVPRKTRKATEQMYNNGKQKQLIPTTKVKDDAKLRFTCETCNRSFAAKPTLRKHMEAHASITARRTKSIKYKEFMVNHFDMHCDYCQFKLESIVDARAHYEDVHDIPNGYVKCCNTKFTKTGAANGHIDFHLNPDSLKCKKCDKQLKSKLHMYQHMKQHEHAATLPFSCDICDNGYRTKDGITMHILSKHVPKGHHQQQFDCKFCHRRFPHIKLCKSHMNSAHKKHPGEICEICGKSFSVKMSLRQHLLTHTDKSARLDKRIQCKYCGEWLLTANGIYYHKKLHTTGQQKCDQCDAILPHRIALQAHIRTHHREHKHKCNDCNRTFETPYKLKLHIESHTRDNSYPCPYCSMVFKIKNSLKSHRRRSHLAEWNREKADRIHEIKTKILNNIEKEIPLLQVQ